MKLSPLTRANGAFLCAILMVLGTSGDAQDLSSYWDRMEQSLRQAKIRKEREISSATRGRMLTPGEIALARSVFGDGIDYGRVKIFSRKWSAFQPSGTLMAPNENIYFPPGRYMTDLSSDDCVFGCRDAF